MSITTFYPPRLAAFAWAEQQKLVPSTPSANDNFGTAVAISGDTIISGAWRDNALAGSAYIYTRAGGVWTEQQKITGSDTVANDTFGRLVAIDGDTVVCGSQADDAGLGAAYVFVRSGGVWTQQQKITEPTPGVFSFGGSVAISGDTLVVSSQATVSGLAAAGAVYVYTRTAGVWSLQQTLTAADPELNAAFGLPVTIDGDTIVAACQYDNGTFADEGSAYVFTRTAGVWTQQQKLVSPTPALTDQFGNAVSVSGDTVVIGCARDDQFALNSGAAFVFTRAAGVWTLRQKLTATPPGVADDRFGVSVSIDNDLLVVGASLRDSGAVNAGSIYIFRLIGGEWVQQIRIDDPAPAFDDRFGTSVSISGTTVVAGAPFDDASVGSAFVFLASTTPSQPLMNGAMFYALMPGDNAATVAGGAAVEFPRDAAVFGPLPPASTTSTSFTVPTAGTYRVSFQVSVSEAGQLQLWRGLAGTTVVPESTATRNAVTSLITNTVILTLVAGEILSIRNPTGAATPLTITAAAGAGQPAATSATFTIVRVG